MTSEERDRIDRLYNSGWTPCFPITNWLGCRALPKSKGRVEPFVLPGWGVFATDGVVVATKFTNMRVGP